MKKDPTQFRERYKRWKSGELVYSAGLPTYSGGKNPDDDDSDILTPEMYDIINSARIESFEAKDDFYSPSMGFKMNDVLDYGSFGDSEKTMSFAGRLNNMNDIGARLFFDTDIIPRLKLHIPGFNKQDLADVNEARNAKFNVTFDDYGENKNNGGWHSGRKIKLLGTNPISRLIGQHLIGTFVNNNKLTFNSKYKFSNPLSVHERTHYYRQGLFGHRLNDNRFNNQLVRHGSNYQRAVGSGYTEYEENLLNAAYDMTGYKRSNGEPLGYPELWEKGTTNAEIRYRLWKLLKDKTNRIPTVNLLNLFINDYDNDKLLQMFEKVNSYGNKMFNNGMDPELVKKALINVAMYEDYNQDVQNLQQPSYYTT